MLVYMSTPKHEYKLLTILIGGIKDGHAKRLQDTKDRKEDR